MLMRAFNLAFSGDKLVVAVENHKLKVFKLMEPSKTIKEASSTPGEFNYPWGVAVDTGGDIHVSCKENDDSGV